MTSRNISAKVFDTLALVGKLGIIFGLLAFAFANGDTTYITKHPSRFLVECVLAGGSSMVASLMIGMNRDVKVKSILTQLFIVFVVFALVHVLKELSGTLHSEQDNKQCAPAHRQVDGILFNTITYGIVACGTLTMIVIALKNKDFGYMREQQSLLKGLLEWVMFGLINGMPMWFILHNRGRSSKNALIGGLQTSGVFGALYILLEGGGFFTRSFSDKHKKT